MRSIPNMLMAGAAGRNRGKTEFLCRAIRAQSKVRPVIGIKISSFDDVDGEALTDRLKSKTYRSIAGDFLATHEEPGNDHKDTHRMYRSGATKVYWLRTRRSALAQGLDHLFETLETDGIDLQASCFVVESSGARNVIEPGLFFIIQEHNDELKPSCAEVAHYADQLVNVRGDGWDLLPEDLVFENGRWGHRENAAAIILSGGESRRMGQDKSIMPILGQPMLSKLVEQLTPNVERVIISGSKEKHAFTGCHVVEDLQPGCGPLMGLLSTLEESAHALNFVTACDIPEIHLPLVRHMLRKIGEHEAVVPLFNDGRKQPLFAVYRKSVTEKIEPLMADGKRSMHALLDRLDVRYLEIDADWYHNLNSPEDVNRYQNQHT